MTKTKLLVSALSALMIIALLLPIFSFGAVADSPKVISGSPGDTLAYTGTGTPNSQVSLEVSASIGVGTTQSGGKCYYQKNMNGLNVPDGNSMSITVMPVDTLTVTGAFSSASMIGYSVSCGVDTNSHVGSYSRSVPAATYNIGVSGIANGSPSSVTMSVRASQPQTVGSDGTYTASISTSGLPATVYTLKANGVVVAMIYLGVAAPATPTPVPTPTPTPTPVPSQSTNATTQVPQGTWLSNNNNNIRTAGNQDILTAGNGTIHKAGNGTILTASITASANGPSATHTPLSTSNGTDLGTWGTAILAIVFGTIIGIVAAYLVIIRKR